VIVGADPKGGRGRGVVSTASYEARRFGVGSAMPVSRAYKLCPQGVYLPVDMRKYVAVSKQVMGVFRRYTDVVEPLSIDGPSSTSRAAARAFGSGPEIAARIKQDIRAETALTASVGVAACSWWRRSRPTCASPTGSWWRQAGEEQPSSPRCRCAGCGRRPKLEEQLARLGVQTIGDLARLDPGRLERRLGTHGLDCCRSREAKTIGP